MPWPCECYNYTIETITAPSYSNSDIGNCAICGINDDYFCGFCEGSNTGYSCSGDTDASDDNGSYIGNCGCVGLCRGRHPDSCNFVDDHPYANCYAPVDTYYGMDPTPGGILSVPYIENVECTLELNPQIGGNYVQHYCCTLGPPNGSYSCHGGGDGCFGETRDCSCSCNEHVCEFKHVLNTLNIGCIEPGACNYNPEILDECHGECYYENEECSCDDMMNPSCIDNSSLNYNPCGLSDCVGTLGGSNNDCCTRLEACIDISSDSCDPHCFTCCDGLGLCIEDPSVPCSPYCDCVQCEDCCVYGGCTDSGAINYDSDVDVDDGSCYNIACLNSDPDIYNYCNSVDKKNTFCYDNGCTECETIIEDLPPGVLDNLDFPRPSREIILWNTRMNPDTLEKFDPGDVGSSVWIDDTESWEGIGSLHYQRNTTTENIGTVIQLKYDYDLTEPLSGDVDAGYNFRHITASGNNRFNLTNVILGNDEDINFYPWRINHQLNPSNNMWDDGIMACFGGLYKQLGHIYGNTYSQEEGWDMEWGSQNHIPFGPINTIYLIIRTGSGSDDEVADFYWDQLTIHYDVEVTPPPPTPAPGYGNCCINDPSLCIYSTCNDNVTPACNYDTICNTHDCINNATCEYESCRGCTDPEAFNYDPDASIDDGSCDYTGQLCVGNGWVCEELPSDVCDEFPGCSWESYSFSMGGVQGGNLRPINVVETTRRKYNILSPEQVNALGPGGNISPSHFYIDTTNKDFDKIEFKKPDDPSIQAVHEYGCSGGTFWQSECVYCCCSYGGGQEGETEPGEGYGSQPCPDWGWNGMFECHVDISNPDCDYDAPPPYEGCMDDTADNYDSGAGIPCDNCCEWRCCGDVCDIYNYDIHPSGEECSHYYISSLYCDAYCKNTIFPSEDPSDCFTLMPCTSQGPITCPTYNDLGGFEVDEYLCELAIVGCTDPEAFNYDENATVECNSSMSVPPESPLTCNDQDPTTGANCCCNYLPPLSGCTYWFANNYNPEASINDGSCNYTVPSFQNNYILYDYASAQFRNEQFPVVFLCQGDSCESGRSNGRNNNRDFIKRLLSYKPTIMTTGNGSRNNGIMINEIHYIPSSFGGVSSTEVHWSHEFIELYNNSENVIDMSGWYFSEGVEFTFPDGVSIPANNFIVVSRPQEYASCDDGVCGDGALCWYEFPFTCDVCDDNYDCPYPPPPWTQEDYEEVLFEGVNLFYWEYGSFLSNTGESITLKDSNETLIDSVTYNNQDPWPFIDDGPLIGRSIERMNYDDSNDGSTWKPTIGSGPFEQHTAGLPPYTDEDYFRSGLYINIDGSIEGFAYGVNQIFVGNIESNMDGNPIIVGNWSSTTPNCNNEFTAECTGEFTSGVITTIIE